MMGLSMAGGGASTAGARFNHHAGHSGAATPETEAGAGAHWQIAHRPLHAPHPGLLPCQRLSRRHLPATVCAVARRRLAGAGGRAVRPRPPLPGDQQLVAQPIDFIDDKAPKGAFLVGHSLGGLLSLLAASKRPDLAQGLVMLDSPVITGWRSHTVQMLKRSRLMQRLGPGKVSITRRHEWPSRQAAFDHYAAKSLFARWAPGMLADYIAAGTVRRGHQVVLAFDRAVETRIYNTLPHQLGATLRRHPLRCPVAFIAGTRSTEIRQGGLTTVRRLAGGRLGWRGGAP